MSLAFDTLKFVERLQAGGFWHDQAKAAAQAFADTTRQQLATKADLLLLKWMVSFTLALVLAVFATLWPRCSERNG